MKKSHLYLLLLSVILCPSCSTKAHRQDGITLFGRFAAYFPDGKRLVTNAGDSLKVYEVATGKMLYVIQAKTDDPRDFNQAFVFTQVIVAPDGQYLFASSQYVVTALGGKLRNHDKEMTVKAWDTANGHVHCVYNPQRGEVRQLLLSTDGRRLYTVSENHAVQTAQPNCSEITCWDTNSGKEIFRIQCPDETAIKPDDGTTVIPNSQLPVKETERIARLRRVTISSDGKLLIGQFITNDGKESSETEAWDALTGKKTQNKVNQVANSTTNNSVVSPDGKYILENNTSSVKVREQSSGKEHNFNSSTIVHGVTFSPDSRRVAAACGDYNEIYGSWGDVKLWDITTEKLLATYKGHNGYLEKVIFSPNGKSLIAINKGGATLHQLPE